MGAFIARIMLQQYPITIITRSEVLPMKFSVCANDLLKRQ